MEMGVSSSSSSTAHFDVLKPVVCFASMSFLGFLSLVGYCSCGSVALGISHLADAASLWICSLLRFLAA
jgi:hypothetical protein